MSSITSPIDAAVKAGLGKEEDFNLTYDRLTHISGKQYYAKSSKNVAQLLGEAEGLRKMTEAAPGLAPTVHIAEEINEGQKAVFVSDYIALGRTNAASLQKLGKSCGGLHLHEY
jgi:fructosamine-3-kinase